MTLDLTRRAFTLAGLSALATPALIRPARAAGSKIVAATFPGSWEDAYRSTLTPTQAQEGFDLTIAPALAQDQIAKLMASRNAPPYDAILVSPGQTDVLIRNDLIEKIDPTRLKNWDKLMPAAQSAWGPHVTIEINGIAYNPDMVDEPTGYKALFEDPQYDKLVAFTGFEQNAAVMAWTEINKLYGGSYDNMQPVWELIAKNIDKLTIATSGDNQMALYQQGEIAVFMCSTGNVAHLNDLGLNCKFAKPASGVPAVPVTIHMVKGASNPDGVYAYMDAAISAAAQTQMAKAPTAMIPMNTDVPYSDEISAFITPEEVAKAAYPDWVAINKHRAAWTEQFDRIVAM
ncbi:extracellular solute-binding protein [Pseudooceanicola sp. CBS1P-1]|uniref:Extracellular solute-binding protein n=1 Tax=Pseudooceanicola albus TaxID=2692189 RepID=A0A6L7G6Z7_9RHOB|nr:MULTISPECIES: extracellular solute-binding protein [Pseudooceanicola]MBT9386120.1 extracellular solute-binding protein [Pseudooceanicola endophyticus]MXN19462.1 extracellular solute-binding protein [Pseudooceanicola albus]